MRAKKMMALVLAGTMVTGSSFAAFAADGDGSSGGLSGTGGVEGIVSYDVWNVVLPTEAAGDTTYDFILDPQGLIADTSNARYANTVFEAGANLYFKSATQTDDGKDRYNSTSDSKTITNKSTTDVDVTMVATVTPGAGITMSSDKDFTDDTSTSVYLALTDGAASDPNVVAVGADNKATMTATIDKAPDGAYEVQWNDTTSKYEYVLTSDAQDADYTGFDTFSFALTGACNTAGDWSDLADAAPAVSVVWAVAPHQDNVDASIGATGTYDKATGVITATVNLGAGTGATTLASAKYGSSIAKATNNVVDPTVTGTTFTGSVTEAVRTGWANLSGPVYVVITLDDGTTQNVTLTIQ